MFVSLVSLASSLSRPIPPFFSPDPPPTAIYTLSLHDALPISASEEELLVLPAGDQCEVEDGAPREHRTGQLVRLQVQAGLLDRKSTRLNSSHVAISYAVFCLKKKKNK